MEHEFRTSLANLYNITALTLLLTLVLMFTQVLVALLIVWKASQVTGLLSALITAMAS